MDKIAIIHAMRTGGTWLRSQLAASTGLPLLCSWDAGLGRDWLRSELFDKLREPRGIVHNHLVNWGPEAVAVANELGWLTVMVAREPMEQCLSLYGFMRRHFGCRGAALDDFLIAQARGEFLWIDWRHWAVPTWWREVRVILPYQRRLFPALAARLGIGGPELPPENASAGSKPLPSKEAMLAFASSEFTARYFSAVGVSAI